MKSTTPSADRMVSVYLAPKRTSATIHVARDGSFLCMDPKIPLGTVQDRPEAQRPTCGRCADILAGKRVD